MSYRDLSGLDHGDFYIERSLKNWSTLVEVPRHIKAQVMRNAAGASPACAHESEIGLPLLNKMKDILSELLTMRIDPLPPYLVLAQANGSLPRVAEAIHRVGGEQAIHAYIRGMRMMWLTL